MEVNRNAQEQIKLDIEHLNSMKTKAKKLHDKGYDVATTEYLMQEINDWIDELQGELKSYKDNKLFIALTTGLELVPMGLAVQDIDIDIDTGSWDGIFDEAGPTKAGATLIPMILASVISGFCKDAGDIGVENQGKLIGGVIRLLEEKLIEA